MKPEEIIIRKLCELLDEHGYSCEEVPQEMAISREAAAGLLTKLTGPRRSPSGLMSVLHRETDYGRVMENDARFNNMISDIGALSDAGVLPEIRAPKVGVIGKVIGALTWGKMSPEEARLLGELRAQGVRRLMSELDDEPFPAPDDEMKRIGEHLDQWAEERGLDLVSETGLDGVRSANVRDLIDTLLVTDPQDGLSGFQEAMVKSQKVGMQGILRDRYENSNRSDDLRSLVSLGVLPEICRAKPAPGAPFISRFFAATKDLFLSSVRAEEVPVLTEMGRSVLREVLRERAGEIALRKEAGPTKDY